jgi:hypothetical protein
VYHRSKNLPNSSSKKGTKHHQEQRTTSFFKNQEPKKKRFGAGVKLNGYATIDHEVLQDKSQNIFGFCWNFSSIRQLSSVAIVESLILIIQTGSSSEKLFH